MRCQKSKINTSSGSIAGGVSDPGTTRPPQKKGGLKQDVVAKFHPNLFTMSVSFASTFKLNFLKKMSISNVPARTSMDLIFFSGAAVVCLLTK